MSFASWKSVSAINNMVYVRGHSQDYDNWAASGNYGWNYKSVIPYFEKLESIHVPAIKNSTAYGKHGYLKDSMNILDEPIKQLLINANRELIYDFYDYEVPMGFFHSLPTIENGIRSSSSKAYLTKVKYQNLYLATNAHVVKILFENTQQAAIGVQVKIAETYVNLFVSKEIVLSAGVINSPQLLILSGIGLQKHLHNLGINIVKNLPVLENLQDHMIFYGLLIKLDEWMLKARNYEYDTYEYFMRKKGSYADSSEFTGFISSGRDSQFPDIQVLHMLHPHNKSAFLEIFLNNIGIEEDIKRSMLEYVEEYTTINIGLVLAQPKSRGKILLSSQDPFEKPLIFPNYLNDPDNEDLETFLRGVNYVMDLLESEALSKYDMDVLQINITNCNHISFKTDDHWRCAIRNFATSINHPCCTCKMGDKKNSTSVVDSRLKVRGIKGLRVIDASIMPNIISRNINGATMMIGEKGADLIKQDWNYPVIHPFSTK